MAQDQLSWWGQNLFLQKCTLRREATGILKNLLSQYTWRMDPSSKRRWTTWRSMAQDLLSRKDRGTAPLGERGKVIFRFQLYFRSNVMFFKKFILWWWRYCHWKKAPSPPNIRISSKPDCRDHYTKLWVIMLFIYMICHNIQSIFIFTGLLVPNSHSAH